MGAGIVTARGWTWGTALLVAACTAGEADLRLDVGISPTPATVGHARILVQVLDRQGQPVPDATVTVRAIPPGASEGAGDGVGGAATWQQGGRYALDGLPLSGAGEWTLQVTAVTPNTREGRYSAPLRVLGDPHAR